MLERKGSLLAIIITLFISAACAGDRETQVNKAILCDHVKNAGGAAYELKEKGLTDAEVKDILLVAFANAKPGEDDAWFFSLTYAAVDKSLDVPHKKFAADMAHAHCVDNIDAYIHDAYLKLKNKNADPEL